MSDFVKVSFDNLRGSDLVIDCIYEGGNRGNAGDDPLPKLFPKCGSGAGFRKKNRNDNTKKPAYVILFTTMDELEWPDYLDEETGVFRYYGDNRKAGRDPLKTHMKGNKLLKDVFNQLNSDESLEDIPPFFIFKKTGRGRDLQFLGLAAPGNPNIPPEKELITFWRTINGRRFQNFESYFTILDTGIEPIRQEWLISLLDDHENNLQYAPDVWKKFIHEGRSGIKALKSPKIPQIPSRQNQLPPDEEGKKCVKIIHDHYEDNPYGFEGCATEIVKKMDSNFDSFKLTQITRDGGFDAIGKYKISSGSNIHDSLDITCFLEAKCYALDNGIDVQKMSRFVSRIKNHEFGVFITTSFIQNQAYKEIKEDGHPILVITAVDIARILRENSINSHNIEEWLNSIDENISR